MFTIYTGNMTTTTSTSTHINHHHTPHPSHQHIQDMTTTHHHHYNTKNSTKSAWTMVNNHYLDPRSYGMLFFFCFCTCQCLYTQVIWLPPPPHTLTTTIHLIHHVDASKTQQLPITTTITPKTVQKRPEQQWILLFGPQVCSSLFFLYFTNVLYR